MKYFLLLLPLIFAPIFAQQKLDASYKIGKDLVLLQTKIVNWYTSKDNDPVLFPPPSGYHAVYWNPKSNEYYYATGEEKFGNLRMTNGLTYKLDPKKQETNHVDEQEYLQYLGSLSPTKRLYLGKDGNQYIKVLYKITNDITTVYPVTGRGITFYTNAEGIRFSRVLGNKYKNSKGTLDPF